MGRAIPSSTSTVLRKSFVIAPSLPIVSAREIVTTSKFHGEPHSPLQTQVVVHRDLDILLGA